MTDAQLTRYRLVLQELGEAYYGRVSQSIMPKWQAHRMEKYLRSLHYNTTGQYFLDGMKVPYPVDLLTGARILPPASGL